MDDQFPKLTTDGVIVENDKILLIRRKYNPFEGRWALPGGFVEYGETTESAVVREVFEETGLHTRILRLVGVYSDPNRDPRGHTITVVYLLEVVGGEMRSGDDSSDAKFFNLNGLPELAFDHGKIIQEALQSF